MPRLTLRLDSGLFHELSIPEGWLPETGSTCNTFVSVPKKRGTAQTRVEDRCFGWCLDVAEEKGLVKHVTPLFDHLLQAVDRKTTVTLDVQLHMAVQLGDDRAIRKTRAKLSRAERLKSLRDIMNVWWSDLHEEWEPPNSRVTKKRKFVCKVRPTPGTTALELILNDTSSLALGTAVDAHHSVIIRPFGEVPELLKRATRMYSSRYPILLDPNRDEYDIWMANHGRWNYNEPRHVWSLREIIVTILPYPNQPVTSATNN